MGNPTDKPFCFCSLSAQPLLHLFTLGARADHPHILHVGRTFCQTVKELFILSLTDILSRRVTTLIWVFLAFVSEFLWKRVGTSVVARSVVDVAPSLGLR